MKTPSIALLLVLLAAPLCAQEPTAVRKVGLPNLDSQVAAKLSALDARLNPVHSPKVAAGLLANLAAPSPLGAFTPMLADPRNQEIWEQLPDDYYRMTQESGDALVASADKAAGSGWTSGQVRRLCHQRLAVLPRSSLALYRERVDAEAKALLEQGKQSRSPLPLRRLVDDLFCSSHADQALDLLGDLAFERGQFDEARHWWGLLVPLEPASADRLLFPDPKVDLVRVEAKQVLALIFQGRLNEARSAITRFTERHPGAKGHLAGQQGVYSKTLARTLDGFKQERIANNTEAWTTFGGDATRNRVLSQGLSVHLLSDGPAWRVLLPVLTAHPERSALTRRAAFHPIIVNDQVLIADHRSVVSYHLTTGKELFRYDLKAAKLIDPGPGISDDVRLPRFSLSADRDRAYVRLGRLTLAPKKAGDKEQPSYLVCLDLTQSHVEKKRELWRIQANADDKSVAFFEGAPLVHDGRVYIALSRLTDRHVVTAIVCYDTLGRQRWTRDVCECPEFEENANGPRYRQHLLTLAGGQIVYCSHAGAIVAVDAWTGQPTWGVRYSSRGPLTADFEPSPRDLAPCVYADGCVYAAPLDSDRVFCLDAVTGQVRWQTEAIEIVHLLGVAHGRVFVTTRNGVQAMRTSNGQTEWTPPGGGRLPSLGRGLLAGGWLYWPMQDLECRAVAMRDGKFQLHGEASVLAEPDQYDQTMLRFLAAGNWALGQGCLAVAGLEELIVFVPPDQLPNRYPKDSRPDARLERMYRDAHIHAYAGRTTEAVQAYKEVLAATKTDAHAVAWRKLIESRLTLVGETRKPALAAAKSVKRDPPRAAIDVPGGPALPLVQAWSAEDGRIWIGEDVRPEIFFGTQAGKVTCRSIADGKQRWQQALDFEPTLVSRWHDRVIIAGPDEALALQIEDGARAWSFAAPSRRFRPGSVIDGRPKLFDASAGFVHFDRDGDSLQLLDDGRHFYQLQLDTGAIAWRHADGAHSPFVARVGERSLVQSSSGQPGWLGTKPAPFGEKSRLWRQAPLVIEGRIILAGERGRILAYDGKPPHAIAWTYQAPFATSLTGELCRLIAKDSVLLALVPRNEGSDWIRLDAQTGKLLWTVAARHLRDVDAGSICVGDTSVYFVRDHELQARSLNDGVLQWTQSLPTRFEHWRVGYTSSYLAVYPADASPEREFLVALVDPWDGRWQQKLACPGARGAGAVLLTPRYALASAGGRIFGFRSLDAE